MSFRKRIFDILLKTFDKKGALKGAKNVMSRDVSHLAGKFVIKWVV